MKQRPPLPSKSSQFPCSPVSLPKDSTSPIRKFSSDVLHYVPALIIPAIVSLVAVAVYTRFLNPEQYGQYILVITTVSIVSSFAFSWLEQAEIRYSEEYRIQGNYPKFISTVFISLAVLAIAVFVIWSITALSFTKNSDTGLVWLMQIGGIVLVAQVFYSSIRMLLRAGRKTVKYGVYATVNSFGVFGVAVCLIILFGFGADAILFAMIVVPGIIVCIELVGYFRNKTIIISKYSFSVLKRFASYGIPMIGVSVGALIVSVSDRYIIKFLMDVNAVGMYSASYNLAQMSVAVVSNIPMLAAFPVILHTFLEKGEKEAGDLIEKLISFYFVALVPVILGVAVLSTDIVRVVLGKSYWGVDTILPLVAFGTFCDRLALYCGVSLKLKEKTMLILYLWIFVGIINIVLNFVWIPIFGIIGAAYATLSAYFIYLLIVWILGCKQISFPFPIKPLLKTVLAGLIMAGILEIWFSDLPRNMAYLCGKITIGALSYFLMLWILRERTFLKSLRFVQKSLFRREKHS